MEKRNADGLTEKEFLEQYHSGNYEKPSVTVDIMVLRMNKNLSKLQILLIQRKDHPCIEQWALPGGFINMDESAYEAACRELKEETNLSKIYLEQLYTMSNPKRDPRMRIIDIAYMALLPYEDTSIVKAGDDAKDAMWFDICFDDDRTLNGQTSNLYLHNAEKNIKIEYQLQQKVFTNGRLKIHNWEPCWNKTVMNNSELAFDHVNIILEGLSRLRNKVLYTDVVFNLVPEEFTLVDLQKVYEEILCKDLYRKNFREKIKEKVVSVDGKKTKPITGTREAQVYKYKE